MAQEIAATVDPRIEAAVERYRTLLRSADAKEVPCDRVLDPTLPDGVRERLLRRLLVEERQHARKFNLPTSFECYFSRSWFDRFIDDLVAVMLEDIYLVEGRLGAGGQGRVYRVRNRNVHNRKEALKIFLPADPQFLKEFDNREYLAMQVRFDRESELLSRVRDAHLPAVHAVGERDGLRFFTMEFVDGDSLAKMVERDGAIEPRRAAEWMLEVAITLVNLHRRNIIHRDIKPSNLILDERGHLFIVDFGLVKIARGLKPDTSTFQNKASLTTSQGFGSRGYVAPEQAVNAATVNTKADIYSLGATFFHLVNGFPSIAISDSPVHWAPHIPKAIQGICNRCMKFNPDERPTAAEVVALLQEWLQGNQNRVHSGRPTRRKWLAVAGGAAIVAAAGYWLFAGKKNIAQAEIQSRAKNLRLEAIARILAARNDAGWFVADEPGKAARIVDISSHAHALAAILLTPEIHEANQNDALRQCGESLRLPFAGTSPAYSIQRDHRQRQVGWLSRGEKALTVADTAIWLATAQACFLLGTEKRQGFETLRGIVRSQLEQTLEVFKVFVEEAGGGWHLFADPVATVTRSVWASALAVQMLLVGRGLGGKTFHIGNATADQILGHTLSYLDEQCRPDRSDSPWVAALDASENPAADQSLSLRIFALQLRASLETEINPWSHVAADWDRLMTALLLQFRKSPPAAEAAMELSARGRDLFGNEKSFRESRRIAWFPQAVALAGELLKRAEKRPEAKLEVKSIRRFLGELIVEQGENAVKAAGTLGPLAEMLIGLSRV